MIELLNVSKLYDAARKATLRNRDELIFGTPEAQAEQKQWFDRMLARARKTQEVEALAPD